MQIIVKAMMQLMEKYRSHLKAALPAKTDVLSLPPGRAAATVIARGGARGRGSHEGMLALVLALDATALTLAVQTVAVEALDVQALALSAAVSAAALTLAAQACPVQAFAVLALWEGAFADEKLVVGVQELAMHHPAAWCGT